MKIYQSWTRNMPTTDGYSLTVTYIYSSKNLSEIDEVEKKLPKGIIVIDTDKPQKIPKFRLNETEEVKHDRIFRDQNIL